MKNLLDFAEFCEHNTRIFFYFVGQGKEMCGVETVWG